MTKKIALSNTRRDVIREYGNNHIKANIDRSKEQKQLAIMLREAGRLRHDRQFGMMVGLMTRAGRL